MAQAKKKQPANQSNLLKGGPRKKKSMPKRIKTGLAGCPLDKGFEACHAYFYDEIAKGDTEKLVKDYIRKTFSKDDAAAIFANPDYHFWLYTGRAAAIFWMNHGLEFEDKYASYPSKVYEIYADLIEPGKKILADKQQKNQTKGTAVSPQELFRRKVNDTLGYEIDYLEDEWIEGKTSTIDLYTLFQKHGIKGAGANHLRPRVQFMYDELYAAYHKKDKDAVEGYDHLTKKEIKRRLDAVSTMLSDLDKVQSAAKTTRKKKATTTKAKAITADKQVAHLKYLKESQEYKLVSVDPITVPGTYRLYTFNTKTRELTEFVTTAANGFEIKGTTIQNFDPEKSRKIRLRKPDDVLPLVLKKTPNQIDKEWSKLTTKESTPTGRINADMVLLRTENK